MERLLVTGIDTLIGSNLALALRDRCEVFGLSLEREIELAEIHTARWPADDAGGIEACIAQWQPQWIVHCGPLAAASWDPAPSPIGGPPETAHVEQLVESAQRWSSRLSVISSDVVMRGPRMFHDERSQAASDSLRAQAVRAMERVLETREVLVVRTHAYGWETGMQGTGFAERAFDALVRQAPLEAMFLDGRRHATPILATDLAALLWRAYESHLCGLYHLAGTERTSPHRFVAELATVLGVPLTSAQPAEVANPLASPSEETSLSSKLARRMLSAPTHMLRDGLERFVAQADSGWRSQLRQSAAPRCLPAIAA